MTVHLLPFPLLCSLPLKLGGLGFPDLSLVAPIAYAVSFVNSNMILNFFPLLDESAVNATLVSLNPFYNSKTSIIADAQKKLTYSLYENLLSDFKKSLTRLQLSSFSHNCLPFSNSFLLAVPASNSLTIDNGTFVFGLKSRLLCFSHASSCPVCEYQDLDLYHFCNCKTISKLRSSRHDELRDLLKSLVPSLQREVEFQIGVKSFRMDLISEDKVGFDLTVVGGHGHLADDDYCHGHMVKVNKYCSLVPSKLSSVVPLVFSVSGGEFTQTIEQFKKFGLEDTLIEFSVCILKWGYRCFNAYNSILGMKSLELLA
ncbi:hypothetical protein RCL1_006604 [Eukaryota sp. TZLM3-RCL]